MTRTPPHNVDAELSVLGAIVMRPLALGDVTPLDPEDFYDPRASHVFRAMRELEAAQLPIDHVTLEDRLRRMEKFDAVGGWSFIADAVSRVGTTANIAHHAKLVRDAAVVRRCIETAGELAEEGYWTLDPEAYVAKYQEAAFAASMPQSAQSAESAKAILKNLIRSMDDRVGSGGVTGISTGLTDLDLITAGMHPTQSIIIAARPAMGKTSLLMSIVLNAAMAAQAIPSLVFSLEMSKAQLVERMLATEARVDSGLLKRGEFRREAAALTAAAGRIGKAPIMIDDQGGISILDIRSRARRWRLKNPGKHVLIGVDYIQLCRGASRSKQQNREQEIGEISRGLKEMAKELECPVLALSQLNRGVEQRADKRPMLSDLRESGSIEQDSDVVLAIFRDEVYDKETKDKGIAEVIVLKQRNGPTDTVRLAFEGRFTAFGNLGSRRDEC